MSRPALALCIPAYRAAWCLPRLLDSARAQEIPFDEILVYDDCSPDDTAEVARRHGARVISGERNVGCSAGKNALLAAASGDWIHFHDADDALLPNFTRLAHRWMARGEACPDVVLFAYDYRENDSGALIQTTRFDGEALRRDPLRYAILHQINPFCGLYRRARLHAVGGYDTDPEILYNEDVAFHCKLAAEGLSFDAEPELSIVNYRVGGSMSGANRLKCTRAHHAVMRRLAARVGARYPREISTRLWSAATALAVADQWPEVAQALALARSLAPGVPPGQGRAFAALCRVLGAPAAFRVREQLIRALKPGLRRPRP